MNNHFAKLAKKANVCNNVPNMPTVYTGTATNLQIYSESIVNECIKLLWTEECNTSDLALEAYNSKVKLIKQHFGIDKHNTSELALEAFNSKVNLIKQQFGIDK